ncbi:MAG: cell surface protein [Gilvibacter sp.]
MHKYLMQLTFGAVTFLLLQSCQFKNDAIVRAKDYELPLEQQAQLTVNDKQNMAFWDAKLTENPNQFPYLAKLATAHDRVFAKTSNIEALFTAADFWKQANEKTNYQTASYLRAAAKNAITRHEFKTAYDLLKLAEQNGEKLQATQLMLFDASLELGLYDQAFSYLEKTKDFTDVDYLIRLAKWEDTQGNLNATIMHMKGILKIAKANKNNALRLWTVTNLGDYYGHAGDIKKSYDSFIDALTIDPQNKYAKKGIAYIAYANDKNASEALRIMKTITKNNMQPDDLLFMAELAEYSGDSAQKEVYLKDFSNLLTIKNYGALYNIPQAVLWLEQGEFKKAIALLQHEVSRRATPETYGALAAGYLASGDIKQAYSIIKEHVQGKTFEPSLLLIEGQILNALQTEEARVKEIKKELSSALYELGPLAKIDIDALHTQ